MGDIQFWLSFNNGALRHQLPVNPETITISSPFSTQEVNISQLGGISVIGERELKDFTFSSFFPRDYNPTFCEHDKIHDPWTYVKNIEKWRDSRKPMRLVITGTPINYAVTLNDFTYDAEKAGNVGDIYYTMTFREYRFVNVKTTKETNNGTVKSSEGNSRPNAKSAPTSYTVKSGDSLWKIAKRLLGDGAKWRSIYDANKKTIGPNPNDLSIGMKLVIPK